MVVFRSSNIFMYSSQKTFEVTTVETVCTTYIPINNKYLQSLQYKQNTFRQCKQSQPSMHTWAEAECLHMPVLNSYSVSYPMKCEKIRK